MTIVDAIQRAKQLRRKGEGAAIPVSVSAPLALEGEVAGTPVPSSTECAVTLRTDSRVESCELARLEYDVNTCIRNHVLVPDVDSRMSQAGAPPYRMLRAKLLQMCRSNAWSSFAVTSPGPGEGKSVTALNLAISMAREGNFDVYLLDLDMRNPSVCRYLGVSVRHEMKEFFAGDCSEADVLFTVGIDRLTIGGGVTGTPHASELLATSKLDQLLAFIRRTSANPLIIFDLPPVVSTDDALVAAPHVDATVLVVSEGTTRRDGLSRALELLSSFKLAGIVLNKTHESIGASYYGA